MSNLGQSRGQLCVNTISVVNDLLPISEVRKGLSLVDVARYYDTQTYRMSRSVLAPA